MTHVDEEPTVYKAMYVRTPFPTVLAANSPLCIITRAWRQRTSTLKDWSVIHKLGNVSRPTLIINDADDEVQDPSVPPLFYGIKKAKRATLGSSSHMPFWEELDKYFGILDEFLTDSGLENGADTQQV